MIVSVGDTGIMKETCKRKDGFVFEKCDKVKATRFGIEGIIGALESEINNIVTVEKGGEEMHVSAHKVEFDKEKIEVGDTVRLNNDLTLKDVRTCLSELYTLMGKGAKKVVGVSKTGMVEIEGAKGVWWNQKYFEIVKKAPKTLYFDARKSKNFGGLMQEELYREGYMECHGLEKSKANDVVKRRYSTDGWVNGMFTTEKPKPLEIIDGVVK